MLRWSRALIPLTVLLFTTTPARAEDAPKPSKSPGYMEVQLYSMTAVGGFNDRAIDGSAPFAAANLRLRGEGLLAGAGFRMLGTNGIWRGGMSLAFFGVPGVSLAHAPLGPDLTLSLQEPWGMSAEAYGGRFFNFGRAAVYADLRLGMTVAKIDVDVRSAMLGDVQTLSRSFLTPLIAPRVGALIRLGRGFSLDVSGSATPVGLERASLCVGFSYLAESQGPPVPWSESH
jgi:hypothetical protein